TYFSLNVTDGVEAAIAEVVGSMLLEGCMSGGNGSPETSRFFVWNTGALTVAFSTLVESNTISGESDIFFVSSGATFKLLSAIVDANYTSHARSVAPQIDCVLTKEQTTFPAGGTEVTTVADVTSLFRSYGLNDDYRIKRGSQAEDYCDTFYYTPADL